MKKYILKLFLLLEGIYLLGWFLGEKLLPLRPDFLGRWFNAQAGYASWLWSRANFDGFYYLKIARDGYQYLQQAFFPAYPLLIRWGHNFWHSYLGVALFISNVSFFLVLWLLAKLLRQEGLDEERIKAILWLLLLFPTSFYFLSVYTESLFLVFVLASFYFLARRNYFWSALLAAAASYTRPLGIFLIPALWVGYYQQLSRRRLKTKLTAAREHARQFGWRRYLYQAIKQRLPFLANFFLLSLGSLGFLKYALYLWRTQGDWLYFAHVQPSFGAQRSISKVIMIYQVIWRYLRMIVTVNHHQWLYFNVWFEFLISLLFLGLLAWGWYRRREYKLPASWLTFATFAYLVPTLTGTFSSMPRYVLVCFPGFVVLDQLLLALEKKKPGRFSWRTIYLFTSFTLLLLAIMLFSRGYWLS